ncbi:MAG: hypothetical protein JWO31_1335, partial [Phycisphaerales bacterium]|nr:hypothetical protein [Phycisphaerales bacterium]
MNVKSWIPLVVAGLLALVALVVARKALSKPGSGPGPGDLVSVAIDARDQQPRGEIGADDILVNNLAAEKTP